LAQNMSTKRSGDDSSAGATCRRAEVNKKKKGRKEGKKERRKTPKQWKTGYSPRTPTSSDHNETLHGGGLWCVVILVMCDPNRSRGYGAVKSKMALPYYFGNWLIQQLVLPYKPW